MAYIDPDREELLRNSANPVAKVFQMNDCDWWAGYDLVSVETAYVSEMGYDDDAIGLALARVDGILDEASELSEGEMDRLIFIHDEGDPERPHDKCTFGERLAEMVAEGMAFPCCFASVCGLMCTTANKMNAEYPYQLVEGEDDPPVVWRDGQNLFILEDGEFCVVCHGHDDLWTHELPRTKADSEPLKFTVCKRCLDGTGYHDWLVQEFEKALEADPTMEKGTDNKWRAKRPE
jgi:hypothetical protein